MVRCDVIGRLAHRGARGQPPSDVTQQSAQNVNKSPGVATSYIRPWASYWFKYFYPGACCRATNDPISGITTEKTPDTFTYRAPSLVYRHGTVAAPRLAGKYRPSKFTHPPTPRLCICDNTRSTYDEAVSSCSMLLTGADVMAVTNLSLSSVLCWRGLSVVTFDAGAGVVALVALVVGP